jgi:hypothetical protein
MSQSQILILLLTQINFFNLDFFTTINNIQVNNYMGDATFAVASTFFLLNLNPNVINDIINSGLDGFCRFNPIAFTPSHSIN